MMPFGRLLITQNAVINAPRGPIIPAAPAGFQEKPSNTTESGFRVLFFAFSEGWGVRAAFQR
jgi:hypothetical protein